MSAIKGTRTTPPGRTPRRDKVILPEFGYWFAGLVDGEGCFYIGANGCQFIICMRADEGPMLEAIQDELGFGRIHYADRKKKNEQPLCRFEVTRKQQLLELVHIFDQFPLRSKKARDYAIWREAVIEHVRTGKRRHFDLARDDLADARKYRGPDYVHVARVPLDVQEPLPLPWGCVP